MVSVHSNTIELHLGVSYQWAIDACDAVVSRIQQAADVIRLRYVACTSAIEANAEKARTETIHAVITTRDNIQGFHASNCKRIRARACASRDLALCSILGISIDQLNSFRQSILTVPLTVDKPAVGSRQRRAVATVHELSIPDHGANVDAAEFRAAIVRVSRAAWHKPSLPILGNILIEAIGTQLRMRTTDLETMLDVTVRAAIADFLPVSVNARDLQKAMAGAKGSVRLATLESGDLELSVGSRRSVLYTIPAEEFPLPIVPASDWHIIPHLCEAIADVLPAVSPDESRQVLCGILLTSDSVVSTDTHRLHISRHGAELVGMNAIIPAKACTILAKALEASTCPVEICISTSNSDLEPRYRTRHIHFRTSAGMLTSKLIEGEFPNFQKVIPQEFSSELTIKPVELRDALESVGVVAKAGTGRVIFTVANGSLNLEASAGGTGTAHASVTLLDSAGTVDRFAMNYAYLLDAVKAFSGSVQLKGSGSEMPFMLCSQAKPNLYAVVMPMHLN